MRVGGAAARTAPMHNGVTTASGSRDWYVPYEIGGHRLR
jgi:hypothetical protein